MGESMTVEGATDALAFEAFTLNTSLPPLFMKGRWWCSMDSGHTEQRASQRELIEARGADLLCSCPPT
jgi:hypothetical protein